MTSSPPPMPAWVLFGLAVTFCATSAILLATLWLLGGACRGVEGPPRTRAGHPVASNPSLPFAADVLALPAGSSIGPGTIAMSVSPGKLAPCTCAPHARPRACSGISSCVPIHPSHTRSSTHLPPMCRPQEGFAPGRSTQRSMHHVHHGHTPRVHSVRPCFAFAVHRPRTHLCIRPRHLRHHCQTDITPSSLLIPPSH